MPLPGSRRDALKQDGEVPGNLSIIQCKSINTRIGYQDRVNSLRSDIPFLNFVRHGSCSRASTSVALNISGSLSTGLCIMGGVVIDDVIVAHCRDPEMPLAEVFPEGVLF